MKVLAERAGISSMIDVDSAGTHASSEGDRPDQRASKAAIARGYDLSGLRARRVCAQDFTRFDRILAMDQQNLASLRRSCPPELWFKLGLFLDYAKEPGLTEVPDPYYGGSEGFERVLDICELAAQSLIAQVVEGTI